MPHSLELKGLFEFLSDIPPGKPSELPKFEYVFGASSSYTPRYIQTIQVFLHIVFFSMSPWNNIPLKSAQRMRKNIMIWFYRRCKVPVRLLLFAIVVCIIFVYSFLNNNILRVSEELVNLQSQVDVVESFRSEKINFEDPMDVAAPAIDTEAPLVNSVQESDTEEQPTPNVHHLREEKKEVGSEIPTAAPMRIAGTLSQIMPISLEENSGFASSYLFRYSAFVLPPPFTCAKSRRRTLPGISSYFQELANTKRDKCKNEDICVHPSRYVNLFTDFTAADIENIKEKDYIVFFQKEYIRGRVDVVSNGELPFTYDCGCFSDHSKALSSSLQHPYKVSGTVVFLLVPNGATIHHFIDSVLPKLVQLEAFLGDTSFRYLLDLSPQYTLVKALLERLGIHPDQLLDYRSIKHLGDGISAERLVVPCNTPPLHPYLWQRAQYLLQLPHIVNPSLFTKNTILYLSRRKGTIGGGRKVVNEAVLEGQLKQFAAEHGYQYVPFFHTDYNDVDSLMQLWSSAAAVIGPHGGAFSNILFAQKGCLVIEFLPNGAIFTGSTFKEHLSTYQQAMLLGHRYFAVMSPFTKRDDMTVNVEEVMNILEKSLLSFCVCYIKVFECLVSSLSSILETDISIPLRNTWMVVLIRIV